VDAGYLSHANLFPENDHKAISMLMEFYLSYFREKCPQLNSREELKELRMLV
jgi:hypothetical protein